MIVRIKDKADQERRDKARTYQRDHKRKTRNEHLNETMNNTRNPNMDSPLSLVLTTIYRLCVLAMLLTIGTQLAKHRSATEPQLQSLVRTVWTDAE